MISVYLKIIRKNKNTRKKNYINIIYLNSNIYF